MNLKQLEAFVKVAETKNFSEAARQLYLTQPTVSAHVASLEKDPGAFRTPGEGEKEAAHRGLYDPISVPHPPDHGAVSGVSIRRRFAGGIYLYLWKGRKRTNDLPGQCGNHIT